MNAGDENGAARKIDTLRRRGELVEAETAAREAMALASNSAEVLIALGRVLLAAHRAGDAGETFSQAEKLSPGDDRPVAWQIAALSQQRYFDEAVNLGLRARERFPGSRLVRVALGRVFLDSSRPDEALPHLAEATTMAPTDATAISWYAAGLAKLHRWEEAATLARGLIEQKPDATKVHCRLGRVLLGNHRLTDALECFDTALGQDPQQSGALEWRITAYRRLHRFDTAEAFAADAIARLPSIAELHVEYAHVFSEQGQYDEALTHVKDALVIDPRDSWALRSRIDFLGWARRFEEAEQAAIEALERRPNDPDVHTTAAWVSSAQDREDEAVVRVEQALVIDPRNSWALRSRISFLRWARRFEEAEQAAAEALERRPDHPDVHTAAAGVFSDRERYDEALRHVNDALVIDPRNWWALRRRIHILRVARRFEEAEQAAAEALERRPDHPDVHTAAAWVFSAQDRYDEALRHVNDALVIDPRDSWALRSRTYFLRWARRFEEAKQAATEALERRPNDPDVHTTAAWVSSAQDREDEAVVRVEQALVIDPRNSWALRSRISFLRWARRFEEAEQAAAEALERRPDHPDVHTAAAGVFSDRERYDEALRHVNDALVIDPRDSWALRSRIDFLRWARRFEEAEQAATEALERRPNDPMVHVTVGWLHDDLHQYKAALACYKKALIVDPRHAKALEWRVMTLRILRRFEDAEQAAAEALVRRPEDVNIRIELGRVHDDRLSFESALTCFTAVLDRESDHPDGHIARSAALRSLRRCSEAERELTRMCHLRPVNRDLKAELGWIHHDENRLVEARRVFHGLLDTAVSARERASARYGLGWVAFAAGTYLDAEHEFRAAVEECSTNLDYKLGLAWALTRQSGEERRRDAEGIALKVAEHRPDPSAHVCLGVLAYKRGDLASAEYHLKKALEIDPYHGSHTDLGALYAQMSRYEEAEIELQGAIKRDWYNVAAHIELGSLFLQMSEERLGDAEQEFRQALAVDPTSGAAAVGLAQTLAKAGREGEAETILREALRRRDTEDRWRTHLALARLLVQRGDKQQNPDLHAEAYAQAQKAIGVAPDTEADPHFVAGVSHHRMGSLTAEARGRLGYRRRAMHHLRECLKRDVGNVDAERNLHLLEREMKSTAPMTWGGYAVAAVSLILLALMWIMFFVSTKVTVMLLSVNTPVLVGLFTVSTLLPVLIRLKLPGFEADLQAGANAISPGPTGEVTFGPGRFTATTGPTGQLPRRE